MTPTGIPRVPGPLLSPAKKMCATCWPMPEIPRAKAWRLRFMSSKPDGKKDSNSLSSFSKLTVSGPGGLSESQRDPEKRDPEKFRIMSQYQEMCSLHEGSQHSNSYGKCQSVRVRGRERTYWPQSSKSSAHRSQDLPPEGWLPPACAVSLRRGLTDRNSLYF